MLHKVNRKLLSRWHWLGRSHVPTPPGRQDTHAQCKPEGSRSSKADPSHPDITSGASAAVNADGEETEQDIRARMDTPGESMTSDPERQDPLDSEEEGVEEEVRVTLRPRRRGPCSRLSESPFRRHSWEPGKSLGLGSCHGYSVSLGSLQDEELEVSAVGTAGQARMSSCGELSLREEEETDPLGISRHWIRGRRARFMSRIGEILDEGAQSGLQIQHQTILPSPDRKDENIGGSTGSHDLHTENGGKVHRTVSFLKKMAGITKTKEKVKEREKEARERETRITNGHLFNTITVSGNTLCYACNKSIITREAFACPNCNVTIHKSCKDGLTSCTKVKQKQLKAAQAKNNSALHSVSMRSKAPLGRERPSSAIYPSDSLRQSPLFSQLSSRRGRTPFQSLSKSVSTNNIGNLNDDTPLGIRRILSQSTDSLNLKNRTLSIESLIDEGADVIYQQLMGDLDADEKCFEADSWSLAVDTNFLQQHKKDVMKRQDVIYELIQTEVHHMRTLKIMSDIFRKGMLEELQMDHCIVDTMFPALDELIEYHVHFLSRLLERRRESLISDSDKNFVINRIGDILASQFSGQNADLLKRAYAEFCSRHTKAVKLYKELFTRDKRFQQFVRRMTRSSVLRRHGIQECILLVTQRITKYPVLLDRILHNTKGNEEDRRDLSNSLALLKDLISAVDQEVHDCEKRYRLQDVYNRMDPKAVAPMHNGRTFQKEDMIRRKLVHDGFLLWKTATGRFKDIQVLLLTDVLVLLQEKDQRYSFPALDNKSAVIPLHKLIIRDIANQEKGLFLISAASQSPEMYELHTSSKDERNIWIKVIQQTVNVCPEMDDFSMEIETKEMLRDLADELQQRDRGITELLEERAGLFQRILQMQSGANLGPELSLRKLFRSESTECPKGEKLINNAIKEVQCLSELMTEVSSSVADVSLVNRAPGGTENTGAPTTANSNEELPSINGSNDICQTDSPTDSGQDRNGNQLQVKSHNEEIIFRLSRLSSILHGLQAIVVKQDSVLEAQKQQLGEQRERLCRQSSREWPLAEQERLRSAEQEREELVGLRRQHSLLQEEFQRCRRTCEERTQEVRVLEARLQEAERSKHELRGQLEEHSRETEAPTEAQAPAQPHRERRKAHSRQLSLPSSQFTSFSPTQDTQHRRRSVDGSCLQGCKDDPAAMLSAQERPEFQELRSEGPECGTTRETVLAPHQEHQAEEEPGDDSEPQSEDEETTGAEETEKILEGHLSRQRAPGGVVVLNEEEIEEEDEEDDDDLYY